MLRRQKEIPSLWYFCFCGQHLNRQLKGKTGLAHEFRGFGERSRGGGQSLNSGPTRQQEKRILSLAGFFSSSSSLPYFIISGPLAHKMIHPHLERVLLPHSPWETFIDTFRVVFTDLADSNLAKLTKKVNHHTFICMARQMQPVAWACSWTRQEDPQHHLLCLLSQVPTRSTW